MKSELVNVSEVTDIYPALYERRGAIVMFEYNECGTVVVGTEDFPLGEFSSELDVANWRRIPSGSQVILTQE